MGASYRDAHRHPRLLDRKVHATLARELSRPAPARMAMEVAWQWGLIACLLWAATLLDHWLAYALAVPLIATRQHALGVLLHEAAHFQLSRHKSLNDLLSDLLLGLPLGILTSAFRQQHLEHHVYVGSDADPELVLEEAPVADWKWPKTPVDGARTLLLDALGVHLLSVGGLLLQWSPWARLLRLHRRMNQLCISQVPWRDLSVREGWTVLCWSGALVAGLTLADAWLGFLLLWLLPALTFFHAIFKFRALTEHVGVPNRNELDASRSIETNWLARVLVAPCNVNRHLEHHLFPTVPCFRLERLHRELLADQTFREHALIQRGGYFGRRGAWGDITVDAPGGEVRARNVVPLAAHRAAFRWYAAARSAKV